MSFQESIIIPLETFKKYQTHKGTDKRQDENVLYDTSLPPDVKMKLYNQEKALKRNIQIPSAVSEPKSNDTTKDYDFIIDSIPTAIQPFVSSILHHLQRFKDQITWNNQLEVIIDGKPFANSNIIKLFQFIMKKITITSDKDIPIAALEFYRKLLEIGVPNAWMKLTFPRKPGRKKGKSTELQIGSGLSWISI